MTSSTETPDPAPTKSKLAEKQRAVIAELQREALRCGATNCESIATAIESNTRALSLLEA